MTFLIVLLSKSYSRAQVRLVFKCLTGYKFPIIQIPFKCISSKMPKSAKCIKSLTSSGLEKQLQMTIIEYL